MDRDQEFARAVALHQAGQFGEAEARYEALAAAYAHDAALFAQWALARLEQGLLEQGLPLLETSLRIDPNQPATENMRGMALARLGRFGEALACHERVIAMAPDYADAYEDRAIALRHFNRLREAADDLRRAVTLAPRSVTAWCNLCFVLTELKLLEEALAAAERAFALYPDYELLRGERLFLKLSLCDWEGLGQQIDEIEVALAQGRLPAQPFKFLAVPAAPARQRQVAERFAQRYDSAPPLLARKTAQRLRIGYFSADFHEHATSYLLANLIELHDRERFEVFAFSFDDAPSDQMRLRLRAGFDRFIDVTAQSDHAIAALARESQIDIAIDLKGYTTGARAGVFAARAAPVQVSYLGFPATMGAPFIDYLIADETIIPPHARGHYSEKIVTLPHTYQVNDPKRVIAARAPSRAELGLPETAFVYCCFNASYKITPDIFDIWMGILRARGDAVLWLLDGGARATTNLREQARTRGVSPDRLIFAPHADLPQHLARHAAADLFLDTFVVNAHTTASDALWAGLPVLTLPGETFASRVGASVVRAIGLDELIAPTRQDYARLATELAADRSRLTALKQKLADNRRTAPLFDAQLFARHIETAYQRMHARAAQGLAPDHITIAPL